MGLGPGPWSPHLLEWAVRLGAVIPSFREAASVLRLITGAQVSEEMLRRATEGAGALLEAYETEEAERLEREQPEAPPGAERQLMSADGAMVPLVGGEFAEVKTLVLGRLSPPVLQQGKPVVHAEALSYFSRLTDSETFARLSLYETHQRGLERAKVVAAPADGAEWLQGLFDYHRPDAVRILDFPHAAGYVHQLAQAAFGEGSPEGADWARGQCELLEAEGPGELLAQGCGFRDQGPQDPSVTEAVNYLERRREQLQYPRFREWALPIGSGSAESAHKSEVQARLKGPGMRWQREHVNPMVALRNSIDNDRWAQGWSQVETRRQLPRRRPPEAEGLRSSAPPQAPRRAAQAPLRPRAERAVTRAEITPQAQPAPEAQRSRPPAADHPWRQDAIGRARYQPRGRHLAKL